MSKKDEIYLNQSNAARNPLQIISNDVKDLGITNQSLKFKASEKFNYILEKLNISLLVSREYENMIIALNAVNNEIKQSFFPIAHPSGMVYNNNENSLFIASTRNPNQLIEFKNNSSFLNRLEDKTKINDDNFLFPVRSKNYPGSYYFHDLEIINNQLYANSVGQNAIIKIDLNSNKHEDIYWKPNSINKNNINANYLQLNSIAAGDSFLDSYFSASVDKPTKLRPGHKRFKVDKQGVIFSAKTGEVIAKGLTRPHSARIHNNKLWVLNSGYGELGYIENQQFISVRKFSSWTRGLYFNDNYAFVGLSKVLPKFTSYAPGLNIKTAGCGIEIINMENYKTEAKIEFPNGNQIFQIIGIEEKKMKFPFKRVKENKNTIRSLFYRFKI